MNIIASGIFQLNSIMIDQKIIANTTATIKIALENADKINDQLSLIKDVLPESCIDKLNALLETNLDWKKVPFQENLNRQMIDWIPESIMEELHNVGDELTDTVKKYYSIDNIKFQALQLWKDNQGYILNSHQDNPVIDIAMQLYLFSNNESEGTTFVIDNKELHLPFKPNTGYILWKKSNEERIPHRTTSISSGERITLYFTWSRFGKQAPDADDPAAFL